MLGVIAGVLLLIVAGTLALDVEHSSLGGRAAHYVLRTSDLNASVVFYKKVFGMQVIRHEESPAACPITCNGNFETPWSKTMVGYSTEDVGYALELTYNYGIKEYLPGDSMLTLVIQVPDVAAAIKAAQRLGHSVMPSLHLDEKWHAVLGPDGYRYLLHPKEAERTEPFEAVRLRVPDPESTGLWYARMLGMELQRLQGGGVQLSFASRSPRQAGSREPVRLIFGPSGTESIRIQQWEGRNAFSVPAAMVQGVYEILTKEDPRRIVHDLQVLDEALGKLYILIIADPNGYEICLVSSETFDPAVKAAATWTDPDWDERRRLALEEYGLFGATDPEEAQAFPI